MSIDRKLGWLAAASLALHPVVISAQEAVGAPVVEAPGQAVQETPPLSTSAPETPAAPPPVELPAQFLPQDDLERGLWLRMDEFERDLKASQQVIHDPELNAYIRSVLCKVAGPDECSGIRLYLMRTPYFNASMAPNGVMQVWSGLLLRTQNEAQLAAVLGHEYVHFKQRHGVKLFREAKEKSNTAAWLSLTGIGVIFALATAGSLFEFSREQEREADMDALELLTAAGYDPAEVAVIWDQLLNEQDATRIARGKKPKKRKERAGMFDTHPTSPERVAYLRTAAATLGSDGKSTGAPEYQRAMRQWWPQFLDDQLKMNDDGASGFLLDSMVKANGESAWLTYARAEWLRRRGSEADLGQAVELYNAAISAGGDIPELWRGRGLALRKIGRADDARIDLNEYLVRAPQAPDHAMIAMIAGGNP